MGWEDNTHTRFMKISPCSLLLSLTCPPICAMLPQQLDCRWGIHSSVYPPHEAEPTTVRPAAQAPLRYSLSVRILHLR
jgi:hypothetical protein